MFAMSVSQEQIVFYNNEGIQAFHLLEKARTEIWNYLPEGFEPDKELEEAHKEQYDSID